MNLREKLKEDFRNKLMESVDSFSSVISTKESDWVVKGFIDIAQNIYTISIDTKVVSKIMELLLFPKLSKFADENKFKMVLSKEQNFYPDITLIDSEENKFALDLKSTYRTSAKEVNGMTLGAFTGYFRDRKSTKNITFSYGDYTGHFVLGVIYSRVDTHIDERRIYKLSELEKITSVIRQFTFFIQEKYKIAIDRPGSGNTKNIGSVQKIEKLLHGAGPFATLGEEVFDDYWMYYLTNDMAKVVDLKKPPYKNLKEYEQYKKVR